MHTPASHHRCRPAAPSEHHPPAGGHKPASKTFLKMQTNMIADTRGTPTPEARTTFFVTNRRASKRRPVKETNPRSPGGRGSVAGLRSPKKISNKTHVTNPPHKARLPRRSAQTAKKRRFIKGEGGGCPSRHAERPSRFLRLLHFCHFFLQPKMW